MTDRATDSMSTVAVNTYIPALSYVLSTSVPAGGGFIDVSPSSKDGTYASGTIITLRAVTDQDHAFNNWGGDATGLKDTITIVMDSDKDITAYFIPM